jgi:hypothetical protein
VGGVLEKGPSGLFLPVFYGLSCLPNQCNVNVSTDELSRCDDGNWHSNTEVKNVIYRTSSRVAPARIVRVVLVAVALALVPLTAHAAADPNNPGPPLVSQNGPGKPIVVTDP